MEIFVILHLCIKSVLTLTDSSKPVMPEKEAKQLDTSLPIFSILREIIILFSLFIADCFCLTIKNFVMDKPMNRIKEVLEEKGIKQTWLAEKLGKSFCIVNSYVCNRRQPSLEVLFQIAEVLQMDVKDLIKSSNND